MKESYDKAFDILCKLEGYISNLKHDDGELTIWGIASKFYPDHVKKMSKMSQDEAKEYAKSFYKKHFWDVNDLDNKPTPYDIIYFCQYVNSPKGAKLSDNPEHDPVVFLNRFKKYYLNVIAQHPEKAVFKTGWFNRLSRLAKMVGINYV